MSLRYRLLVPALMALAFLPALPARAFGPAASLSVTPASLELTADQTVSLKVTATDATKTTLDVTGASVYSSNEPRATFTGTQFTPGKVGSWTIGVEYQGLNVAVPVVVTAGTLAELNINPNSDPEVVALNRTTTFTVAGYDAKSNPLKVTGLSWSVSGGLGAIDATGKFTPSTIGTGLVIVSKGAINTSIPVKVVAERIIGTPKNTNVATNANANSNANTNSTANANTNAPASTNLNVNGSTDDTKAVDNCTSRANWLWGILLLALLGGTAILYAFVPVTKTWPAIVGLGAAVILSVIERTYGCAGNAWWPWVAILGAAALTIFAYQQTPKTTT